MLALALEQFQAVDKFSNCWLKERPNLIQVKQ